MVIYHGIVLLHWPQVSNTMVIYHGILLTIEKVGTAVNYHGIFITLAKIPQYFDPRKRRYHGKLLQYFYNIGPWGHIHNTSFYLHLTNELQKLECSFLKSLSCQV